MSPHIQEGAKKLLKDIGPMKKKKFSDLFPKEAGYSKTDLKNASDLLEKMIQWDPTKRISAEMALEHKFFDGLSFD
jgi:mitogen-activated protein kinase 15